MLLYNHNQRGDEREAASRVAERMGLADGWTPGGAAMLVAGAVVAAAPTPAAAARSILLVNELRAACRGLDFAWPVAWAGA